MGYDGDGTLNVTDGGDVVTNTGGYIGYNSGSTGEATVTGAGSLWNNSVDLWIGSNESVAGSAGTLNLNNSGLVTVTDITKLWATGTLNLDGGNLTTGSFDNSEVGNLNFHDGTLTVNGAGGVYNPGTAEFIIDGNAAEDAPHSVIANTTTTTLAGALKVGDIHQGFLTVESGGVVSNTIGSIGYNSTSTGEATVTGAGSKWNNSAELYVGSGGSGILNVEAGGEISNTHSDIGEKIGSTGVATVTAAACTAGKSSAIRMAMIAMTTSNSTSVKPPTIGFWAWRNCFLDIMGKHIREPKSV